MVRGKKPTCGILTMLPAQAQVLGARLATVDHTLLGALTPPPYESQLSDTSRQESVKTIRNVIEQQRTPCLQHNPWRTL